MASTVRIEVFSREECTHCQDQKAFFEELSQSRSDFEVIYLDLTVPENKELWENITEIDGLPKVTPITLIGDTLIQGFATNETSGKRMIELIDRYGQKEPTIQGFEAYLALGGTKNIEKVEGGVCTDECILEPTSGILNEIPLPFTTKTISIAGLSLPILSAVLGFIDGFNPCAMWVLVTFLVILSQLKSRKKMFIYAGLFVVAEAVMYTLILTVWYTTWDFVGLDKIVTPIVGAIAIAGGSFFLYEFKTSKTGECAVTNLNQRQKIRNRIKDIINKPLTLSTVLGIIFIAFSVNVIEFACSIGIPQTFTKILELNNLSRVGSMAMVAIYILMYMVDDFIVFGLALYSFDKIGATGKYSKLSNLLGGVLLLILGAILILNPDLLQII